MDAIKRKAIVQEMHNMLKESVAGIQKELNEFPPDMYIDERMAGLGTALIQTHIATIVEAMFKMKIPASVLAEAFMRMDSREREVILIIVALAANAGSKSKDDKK